MCMLLLNDLKKWEKKNGSDWDYGGLSVGDLNHSLAGNTIPFPRDCSGRWDSFENMHVFDDRHESRLLVFGATNCFLSRVRRIRSFKNSHGTVGFA